MKSMLMSSHFQSEYSTIATILPVSCSWTLPSYKYHILTHSELSCISSLSTRMLTQIMIHIGTTWMNRVPRCMSFVKNLLFQGCSLWHYQSYFEPQCAFRILAETCDLLVTFSHSSLDMPHAFITLLCVNDLSPQGRCESNVEQ
jgi:hypothetical protein